MKSVEIGEKVLSTGNEAIAEAAVQSGCRFYAGYPITPQNEIPEYMSRRMPEVGGTFIQSESEIAAINMVFGALAAGARAMTSSSSPGISLKLEGISYIAGCKLPAVIVNMMRGGPGLGDIRPSQSDYFQAVKGGGHGDYRLITLAPATVQEAYDLTYEAFYLADKYTNPVMILGDGILGQMMEPLEVREFSFPELPEKDYKLDGCRDREPRSVHSLYLKEGELEELNNELQEKYKVIQKDVCRVEVINEEDSELFLVAYGSVFRICRSVMQEARKRGYKVGIIRPITLWPFPSEKIASLCGGGRNFLVVEMSAGQMVEDVRLAVNGEAGVYFKGRTGGGVPDESKIMKKIEEIFENE